MRITTSPKAKKDINVNTKMYVNTYVWQKGNVEDVISPLGKSVE